MRKTAILTLIAILCIPFGAKGQENLSGLENVHAIDVTGNIKLEIRIQDEPGLEIKSDDVEIDCFSHSIEEGVLTLRIRTNINCDGEVKAILSIPSLSSIKLTGKADIYNTGILKTDSLVIYQQMGSKAYLDIDVKKLDAQLMEGSVLDVKGYADSQLVSVNSKAIYDALNLQSENIDISAKLLGIAKICADKQLKASASANAHILYRCEPEVTDFQTRLGGNIEKSTE
ncbi:MAG: DUF2807 domain-containing protein [Bacteroidales bacterium]|nr:DUF2807 domain-containing protein [Bacteroidales bacterium]